MAKNENEKHDHKWTKLLKVGIFACMMLAPLFAIGVKCAYVTFNKNAKDSYSNVLETEQIQYNEITNINTFEIGKQYNFNTYLVNLPSSTNQINFSFNLEIINVKQNSGNTWINEQVRKITLYRVPSQPNTSVVLYTFDANNIQLGSGTIVNSAVNFDFIFNSTIGNVANYDYFTTLFYEQTLITNNGNTLDNVFYYAVDQMKENELFNWTQNTAIYNGVNAVTTGLGITTDAIPILLVYWILLTLIYVIFDIVIETFTWLTHLFSNKVIK